MRFMNSCRFVLNLLRYTCAKIYLSVNFFKKLLQKQNGAFFETRCILDPLFLCHAPTGLIDS